MPEYPSNETINKASETAAKVVADATITAQAIVSEATKTAAELVRSNQDPTNGTLKVMIDSQDRRTEERHKENTGTLNEIRADVKEVKKQTIETNGRVNKLEWWRSGLVWFVSFLVALIGIAFPLLRIVVRSDIETTVDESVSRALSKYNIVIE